MGRKITRILILGGLFFSLGSRYAPLSSLEVEKGTFSIYFMDEKVGFEDFVWREDEFGFHLTVSGRILKPIRMEIRELTLRLDAGYIPTRFRFEGSVSGMVQEVNSEIRDGDVKNIVRVQNHDQESTLQIKRDAFLLPLSVFSPYMVVTKKYRCHGGEDLELSAYIIPQVETPFSLSRSPEDPCTLIIQMGASQIVLNTDDSGRLLAVSVPMQKLRIVRDR